MRLSLEEELEIRLMRLIYAKDIMGWSADIQGNVFNRKGEKIGSLKKDGYLISGYRIKKKYYNVALHQFVYWYFTGEVHEQIDHKSLINRDVFPFGRNDNRLVNLRPATPSENQQNKNAKGYCWRKDRQKWIAYIYLNGKRKNLGSFVEKEAAHETYLAAKKKYHII